MTDDTATAAPTTLTGQRDDACSRRMVDVADLGSVCDLLAACDIAVVGFADFTRDEVAASLRRADREHQGWYDGSGELVGYVSIERTPDSNQVEFDGYVHPDHDAALGDTILAFAESRGRALVAADGFADAWFGTGVFRQNCRARVWLERAGFDVRTRFTRMRIDFDGPPARRELPDGMTVGQISTEDDLRVAHSLVERSFAEHYGHVPRSFEFFRSRLFEQGEDFSTVFTADLDGAPVGLMVETRAFETDENAGYVAILGVLSSARGRGIASWLLADSFDRAYAAGRAAVLLHVDVANVTDALRLYESVGMRTVLEIDAWAKGNRDELTTAG